MLKVPAVLNGPISALPPEMLTLLTVGAPGSAVSCGVPLDHLPLVIMCKTWTSSISVTFEPLEILTHFCTKLVESMWTVPLAQPGTPPPPPPPPPPPLVVGVVPVMGTVPGREQAANKILPSANTTRNVNRTLSRLLFIALLPLKSKYHFSVSVSLLLLQQEYARWLNREAGTEVYAAKILTRPLLYSIPYYKSICNSRNRANTRYFVGYLPDITLAGLLFGTYVCLDFHAAAWYAWNVPEREPQGSKDTLAPGERPRIGNPKGDLMKPMKKPIRLLGMVFQIDQ